MLTLATVITTIRRSCLLAVLALVVLGSATAQSYIIKPQHREVNFLHADSEQPKLDRTLNLPASLERFDFSDRLICFKATVDGKEGNFILDTGAPQVLLNNHGKASHRSAPQGLAAGGAVKLSDHFIESFILSGKEHRRMWALSLDLRPMELRLGREIEGFVGYDLLSQGELRVDYQRQTFQTLKSVKRPRHAGRAPDHVIKFDLVDHLPVVTLKSGKQKIRLALDTGTSTNLLSKRLTELTLPTGQQMNIQGLDGSAHVVNKTTLINNLDLPNTGAEIEFVLMELSSLGSQSGSGRIDGILGSSYLAKFTVGIDYQRRRLYLWNQP